MQKSKLHAKIKNLGIRLVLPFALSFLLLHFAFLIWLAEPASAQQTIEGYRLIVGFPEIGGFTTGKTLATFFSYLFNVSLVISAIAAFGALLFGGVMYMVSGAVDAKSRAREIIQGAFSGILLLAATWMILNYISPGLTTPSLPSFPPPLTISQVAASASKGYGERCSPDKVGECLSGKCVGEIDFTCGKSTLGGRCKAAIDCEAATPALVCDNTSKCKRGFEAACAADAECANGLKCLFKGATKQCLPPEGSTCYPLCGF